jgi:hypothetical protein
VQTLAGVRSHPCLPPWARAARARLDAIATRGVRAALRLGVAELPPLAAWEIALPDECAAAAYRKHNVAATRDAQHAAKPQSIDAPREITALSLV